MNVLLYSFNLPLACGSIPYHVMGLGVDRQNYLYVGYDSAGCHGRPVPYGRQGVFVYAPGHRGGTPLAQFHTADPGIDFAFDADGNAYIAEEFQRVIEVYSTPHARAHYLRSLRSDQGRCIGPVAFDRRSQLYTVRCHLYSGQADVGVYPRTAHGASTPSRTISEPGSLNCCWISISGLGLYVSDGYNTIYELNKDGRGVEQPVATAQTSARIGPGNLRIGP